ncbi:MAG: hypothetical protein Q9165_007987 [Trypethelium subeluteriae]
MGTPHQGGSGVQLGKLLVNVASVFIPADDRLVKHLERDSEWLQQQLGQYGPISGEFVTKFAFEEYKTPTALGHSIMVVPRASAVVPGAADAEPIAIHADHINMVKFTSKEDNGYETVSGHLQIMVQSASDIITFRWEEESRVDAARINSEVSFSIVFSLSEVLETNHFVARQEELDTIQKKLSDSTTRRAVILHGLGGIGKTQLAIAYAKAHRDDYSAIFWLNIKDEVSVKQSYSQIARRIRKEYPFASELGAITDDSQLDEVVAAVKRWLDYAKNSQWLMVFDNYDNPKVLGNTDPDPAADQLARKLDGLPLALATAGAYLKQMSTSFADYLRLYDEEWRKLQKYSPQVSSYDRQLYSTWQLSLDHIRQQNKHSAKLLQLWAYFDNQDLWFELLREGRSSGPEWLCQITEDELSFNEVVRVLCDHGLVEIDNSSKENGVELQGYGMHSCVHSWTVHIVNEEWDSELVGLALECVGSHVPNSHVQNFWVTQRRLLRHADRYWRILSNDRLDNHSKDWVLQRFGDMYSDQGRLDKAEKMYQRALQGTEKAWGPDHTSTLDTVNNLGLLYVDLGRLDEAEKMYQRALQGKEKAWGPDHTSTLDTVNNLGLLYVDLGRLDEAEKMYQRALQGYEKVLS